MPFSFRLGRNEVHLPGVALTLGLAAAGGFAAQALGLPLPFMLGSLLAVAGAALAGLRLAGRPPHVPLQLRAIAIPVIGVSIGGAFRPEIFAEARHWWPSLVCLVIFIPVAHQIGYRALKASGRVDAPTAYFGSAPGGLLETIQMGEEMGADIPMLTMLQFLRLILTVVLVPIGFAILTGHAVGSAGGATLGGGTLPLGLQDVAILFAAGAIGCWAGMRIGMPAGLVTGPLVLSAAAHLAGLTQTVPPQWMIAATQTVIGTTLGMRFAGVRMQSLLLALRLALVNFGVMMAMALVIGITFAPLVQEPATAVMLAFAPGGLAEMSLVAVSLQISVIYVTLHHVLRIVLAVLFAKLFARHLRG
ncbi:AbrB family transcriptional regulator [Frigidibacter oleivorans]|uniref:AbrB family transcriptional regulator n=1 Tax=Frigidibacter oleivorans TaxID=2487129 RepID=UPI0013DECFAD|nr:AbrB family transcriptional regulator [Frigidibacter oleivorans]